MSADTFSWFSWNSSIFQGNQQFTSELVSTTKHNTAPQFVLALARILDVWVALTARSPNSRTRDTFVSQRQSASHLFAERSSCAARLVVQRFGIFKTIYWFDYGKSIRDLISLAFALELWQINCCWRCGKRAHFVRDRDRDKSLIAYLCIGCIVFVRLCFMIAYGDSFCDQLG